MMRTGALVLVSLLALTADGLAEQLPIRAYTSADGLPDDRVRQIVRDSRGFLWFCTAGGLARFDGGRFRTWAADQGLVQSDVVALIETQPQIYLLGTTEGLVLFDARGGARTFTLLAGPGPAPPAIRALLQDRRGRIWVGAAEGLFRLEVAGDSARLDPVDLGVRPRHPGQPVFVSSLMEDRLGSIWVATSTAVIRMTPDGRLDRVPGGAGLPDADALSLLEDRHGGIWVGTSDGVARLAGGPGAADRVVSETYLSLPGGAKLWAARLFEAGDGRIWVSLPGHGLLRLEAEPSGGSRAQRLFSTADGLSERRISSIVEDPAGNLWLGTDTSGAMRLARGGLTHFAEPEGLIEPRIASLIETREGDLCAVSSDHRIYRLDGHRFVPVRPNVPPDALTGAWGWFQWTLQDHVGDWWIPTGRGLFRFSRIGSLEDLTRRRPDRVDTSLDGLAGDDIFRLFEDRRGDIWISASRSSRGPCLRWDRRTGRVETWAPPEPLRDLAPSAFAEDGRGGLWIGFYLGGLARQKQGKVDFFPPRSACPAGVIRGLYLDRAGRMWVATSEGGAARIDDPSAESPRFVRYTTAEGLSSNLVSCVTEDAAGRIYLGTSRGLDRLDVSTGRIRHFTTAEGLPNNFVNVAHRDRRGDLWFGTLRGVARLIPEPDPPRPPSSVWISEVRVAGRAAALSELGERSVPAITMPAGAGSVEVGFFGIGFDPGAASLYQYRLEGADPEWSEPAAARSVVYANLAPGTYRFLVRSADAAVAGDPEPASATFIILPPLWRRGWFLGLAAAGLAASAYLLHRARLARLVELERVRMRIATDLHDDVGSSLSQIAILSEVALRGAEGRDAPAAGALARIAGTARELVDTMGDIVWAVNPARDRVSDLAHRMRRFASDVFTARDIRFRLHLPEADQDALLDAHLKREVYLIFKESVNNAARHSGCDEAEIALRIEPGRLRLSVTDNGRGFDPGAATDGHGLAGMARRARRLDGALDVTSAPGRGTTVSLTLPLKRRRWRLTPSRRPHEQVGPPGAGRV